MLARLPITARVVGQHIFYDSPHFYVLTTMALYLIGTCASLMVSSHRRVAAFGIAAFVSAVAAYVFYATWFIWCGASSQPSSASCCGRSVNLKRGSPCHDGSFGRLQARTRLPRAPPCMMGWWR
jgi:hypothetical protein